MSKSASATNGSGVPQTSKTSGSSSRSNQNRADLDSNHSDKGRGCRNSDEKSRSSKARDESRRRAKYEATKNPDQAKSTPSAPSKRKNDKVISPTGFTPPEKAKASGTCTFNSYQLP